MHLLRMAARLAVIVVLVVAMGLAALMVVIPRATQGAALTVLTGSMRPTIPPGSLVLVRPVQPAAIKPGDVITFQPDPKLQSLVTHRVVAINWDGPSLSFVTRGDANRIADIKPVVAEAVRGKVWFHVPYIGFLKNFAGTRGGVLLLVGGPAVLYIGQQLRLFAKDRKRHGRLDGTTELRTLVANVKVGSGRHVAVDALSSRLSGQILYQCDDRLVIAVTDTTLEIKNLLQSMTDCDADITLSEPFVVSAFIDREAVGL